jgi:hypothetical protein
MMIMHSMCDTSGTAQAALTCRTLEVMEVSSRSRRKMPVQTAFQAQLQAELLARLLARTASNSSLICQQPACLLLLHTVCLP